MPKQSTIQALYRDILMCLVFGLLVVSAHAARQPESKIGEPVFFVNQGQWEQQVLAKAPLNVGDLWITQQGFIFNLLDTAATERVHDRSTAITRVQTHAVFLKFVNPNKGLTCEYDGQLSEAYYNFYKGNKRKSVVKARKYSTIRVKNVWPGIDLEIMSHQGTIKYNWILSPNANAAQIQWQYQGHNQIEITANHCEIQTPWLSWQESIPAVYWQNTQSNGIQPKTEESLSNVAFDVVSTVSQGDGLGFINTIAFKNIPDVRKQTLVIDPILVFSTYTGSRADNFGCTGTYDDLGNGYAGGTVFDIGLPVTPGAAQFDFGGGVDEDLGYGGSRD
ncbi:MAG: hypothetical protein ACK45C_10145, partial [Bacteroidota bacterium]